MKIIHISDTHLGAASYRKLSVDGYNQREEDILSSFANAIDKILKLKPDLVLHAGDLFDTVRPTNRIIRFAIEQILRLSEAKIPLVLISGNHETPKQRYMGSAFSILEILPDPDRLRHIIYKNKYTPIELKGITIHAIPQCTTDEIFQRELDQVKINPKTKNIAMLHAGVKDMEEFTHGELNELLVDSKFFKKGFDYVALGHFHNFVEVASNAYFSGSPDRLSFNEEKLSKGFIEINLKTKLEVKFHKIKVREMRTLPNINARNLDTEQLTEKIEAAMSQAEPAGKILRVKVINIQSHILSTLDIKKIKGLGASALHFEITFEKIEDKKNKTDSQKSTIGNLQEEFVSFLENFTVLEKEEKNRLKIVGGKYLSLVQEENAD